METICIQYQKRTMKEVGTTDVETIFRKPGEINTCLFYPTRDSMQTVLPVAGWRLKNKIEKNSRVYFPIGIENTIDKHSDH